MSNKVIADAIVATLVAQKLFYLDSQPALRRYVMDKSFPLEERFLIWANHCKKNEGGWYPDASEFGIIGKMVNACDPMDYDRYATYDWDWFLDYIQDDEDLATKYGVTVDEFKEQLIETNFGSFVMDW